MTKNLKQNININHLQHQDAVQKQEQDKIPEEVVKENMSIVEILASNIMARGSLPVGIDFDDLVSWGFEGLIKAYRNFKPDKGSKFKTYAYYRIRGEIFDKIRREWQYRNPNDYYEYRKKIRERIVSVTEEALKDDDGNTKETTENKVESIVANSSVVCLLSLESIGEIESKPINLIDVETENQSMLWEEIRSLEPQEQEIIELFYINNFKQKEIAEKLNCSRSKICRIHMRILEKLRRRLQKRFNQRE
jgi:RNA polymerase sigma factor FliA